MYSFFNFNFNLFPHIKRYYTNKITLSLWNYGHFSSEFRMRQLQYNKMNTVTKYKITESKSQISLTSDSICHFLHKAHSALISQYFKFKALSWRLKRTQSLIVFENRPQRVHFSDRGMQLSARSSDMRGAQRAAPLSLWQLAPFVIHSLTGAT